MKMMTIKCANTLLEDEPTRRDEAPVFHRFHARCACVASRQQRHRRQQAKHRVLKRAASASTLRHEARCATQRRADRERMGMSVLNDQRTTKGSRKIRHNRGIMGRDRDTTLPTVEQPRFRDVRGSWSRRARTGGRRRSPRRKGSRAPGPSPWSVTKDTCGAAFKHRVIQAPQRDGGRVPKRRL